MKLEISLRGFVTEIILQDNYSKKSKTDLEDEIKDSIEKAIGILSSKYAFLSEGENGYEKVLDEETKVYLMDVLNSRENYEFELLKVVYPNNKLEAEAQYEKFLRYKSEDYDLNIYKFIKDLKRI